MKLHLAILAAAVAALATGCSDPVESSDDQAGPTKITVLVNAADQPPEEDVIKNELDKRLGIDVELVAIGGDEYRNQLNASIAGGDPPHLFQVDRTTLKQYVDQGLVLDLTDYMEADLDDYTRVVGRESRMMAQFDGRDYAIVKRPTYYYNSYWIRKDWLDKLQLDMPATVDDLFEVAKAFTEQDPDGNGRDDTYGFAAASDGSTWIPLWAAFGSGGPGNFYRKDGEFVNGYYDPATTDALEYIRRLVAAKVVDPDFVTNDMTRAHERAMQGKAGIVFHQ